jgi:hypothetical protein
MREIEFRGIRVSDPDEWAIGYFCTIQNMEHYILEPCSIGLIHTEVIPETVGLYRGLTDKNGVKVFEGDIVKVDDRLFVVEWSKEWHGFNLIFDARPIEAFPYKSEEIEVMGNIHQNKELL